MQMQAMQVDTSAIQVLISKMHVQMAKAEGNISSFKQDGGGGVRLVIR